MNRLTRLLNSVNSSESRRMFNLTTSIRTKTSLPRRCNPFPGRRSGRTSRQVVLPEELSRDVVVLTSNSVARGGVCNVYVVGTIHDSKKSCDQVRAIINYLKPQVVFLELCSERKNMLDRRNYKKHIPLSEFCVAYEEAMKYGGKVILGDRPNSITLLRTCRKMPLRHHLKWKYRAFLSPLDLLKRLYTAFSSPMDLNKTEMDNDDNWEVVGQKWRKQFPTMEETITQERDQYMTFKLQTIARNHSSVVAVIGRAHLKGIENYWKQTISESQIKDLMEIPPIDAAFTLVGVVVGGVIIGGAIIVRILF